MASNRVRNAAVCIANGATGKRWRCSSHDVIAVNLSIVQIAGTLLGKTFDFLFFHTFFCVLTPALLDYADIDHAMG